MQEMVTMEPTADAPPGVPASRRRVFEVAGGAAAAGALAAFLAACGGAGSSQESADFDIPTANDLSIANFALLLEHLESSFYEAVVDSGVIAEAGLSRTIGQIYADEREHVDALAALVEQLGGTPVSSPEADFEPVIRRGEEEVLKVAGELENLGAAAYLGQAARIQAPDILALILSIHTVEARHAAAVNNAARLLDAAIGPDTARLLDADQVEEELEPYLPKVAEEAKEEPQ